MRIPDTTTLVGSWMSLEDAVEGLRRYLRHELATQLSERIRADEQAGRPQPGPEERRAQAESILREAAEDYAGALLNRGRRIVSEENESAAIAQVLDEFFGMGGLEPLLRNPQVENINVNGADRVFVRYADGRREQVAPVAATDEDLVRLVRDLAGRGGAQERHFDRATPGVSFELPGGERAFAVMAVSRRPALAIRRHRHPRVTLARLKQLGTIDDRLESLLTAMVRARKNILVSGGTGMGKTTLLRALAAEIPAQERLITIEDTFELGLDTDRRAHPDVVALQAREPNTEGEGAIELGELVRWALRMSPDRVIVGEVRGPEVVPMCNAMSQGNDGSLGTLHASSSAGAFTKLAAYAAQSAERLPMEATNLLIAGAIHFVVHLDRPRGAEHQRVVASVREVVGADERQVISNEIFRPGHDRRAVTGVPMRAETLDELRAAGFSPGLMERRRA
ncbi:ATPase, T2SS/T4P/T4SS family [Streptomyces sp. DSM 44917]|uniref:ATPase, T2SS/T4P/T4SS family n=1 Tax=Streptomyces boetiae TaxID=3075541 RepID=A0ABU2L745_9ACTN|nr:ATPase, T2SS/T4P/T4SS family [Streptomyces sp. DSM 44917]MDT0307271.1 ATPase, T2SS/T4P/T4SS family [Streptomyces sp. DSM 44917]